MAFDLGLDLAWYNGSLPYSGIYALTSTIVLMLLFIAQAIVVMVMTNKVYKLTKQVQEEKMANE